MHDRRLGIFRLLGLSVLLTVAGAFVSPQGELIASGSAVYADVAASASAEEQACVSPAVSLTEEAANRAEFEQRLGSLIELSIALVSGLEQPFSDSWGLAPGWAFASSGGAPSSLQVLKVRWQV